MDSTNPLAQPLGSKEESALEHTLLRRSGVSFLNIFDDKFDADGFPTVFNVKAMEVKVFLRVVYFTIANFLWEGEEAKRPGVLEHLLWLQYLEWFEALPVSSNLLTSQNLKVYDLIDLMLSREYYNLEGLKLLRAVGQQEVNQNQERLGSLTYRHWRSEIERETILNYISTLVLNRTTQRSNVPKSKSGMSSEYSNPPKKVLPNVLYTPRTRELSRQELVESLNLSPKERKDRFSSPGN